MSLPQSSPRLPSPPPPTEIQIGPKSPSLRDSSGAQETVIEQGMLAANATRRIHPGTKAADMAAGPPLVPLMELDSAFQLQEHLKALHFHHTKPPDGTHTIPISRSTASLITTPPNGVDRALWLYELCRFLINKCNDIIVGFLFDQPPCSSNSCPEMRASEWQFLCAVHESPKSCCAIDYCCHTLDWATNIVTSQKIFPSRLSLGAGDTSGERGDGVKHLINIFRRLHRIFAHAWFQHREVFWRVEGQTGLYVLFKTVCDNYELLPAENYKLPPEAEGLEPVSENKITHTILKPEIVPSVNVENKPEEDPNFMGVGYTSTRRHIRSSPSTGSAVTTVIEADEDDADFAQKLEQMHVKDSGIERVDEQTSETKENEGFEVEVETEAVPTVETEVGGVEETRVVQEPAVTGEKDKDLNMVEAGKNDMVGSGEIDVGGDEGKVTTKAEAASSANIVSEDHSQNTEKPNEEVREVGPLDRETTVTIPVIVEDKTPTDDKEKIDAEPELLLASESS